jgi:hypothetical protein
VVRQHLRDDGFVAGDGAQGGRVGDARLQAVDGNPPWRQFQGQLAGVCLQRGFGGRRRRHSWRRRAALRGFSSRRCGFLGEQIRVYQVLRPVHQAVRHHFEGYIHLSFLIA